MIAKWKERNGMNHSSDALSRFSILDSLMDEEGEKRRRDRM